ncbi:MAG TPA: glycosyltransferase [Terriglobales bacterium]|nr:glycosyltransferase [Terriglobales bacterium]
MRKLTIVFHHAGGGHRSAADALNATLSSQADPWDVSLLDIQELLDPLDLLRRATGLRIQDIYNLILRKGWTRFTPQLLVVLQGTIRAYHSPIVKALRAYWAQHTADLALSVIPHFNRAIADSLRPEDPRTVDTHTFAQNAKVWGTRPFVTLITDLADYPPHFWIERESEYIIAGTERARQQALTMGHSAGHIFQTSGMILKPRFYEKTTVDPVAERKRLGLEPDCPTAIVLFGGHGSQVMVDITRKLNEADSGVQLILICGHNQKLADKLRKLPTRKPIAVVGFAQNVEYYMALADFFIGKPGPGSISEALQFHLPVIVECNSKTLPQERYNAEWVTDNGYGIVVPSFKRIAPAVQRLLGRATFNEFRRKAGEYSNRALLEVPVILERCVEHVAAMQSQANFRHEPLEVHRDAG